MKKRRRFRKRILFGVSFLLLSLTASCINHRPAQRFSPSSLDPTEFRLVTWNVGYFALSSDKNLRDVDIETIADTVRLTEAHAVILQEVSSENQAHTVVGNLGESWEAHTVETGHQGQILVILSRLPALDVRSADAGGRQILGVTLRHVTGKLISLTGVHSPHPARGVQDTKDNIRAAHAFTLQQPGDVRVFAGDLNFQFDESEPETDDLYREILTEMGDSTLDIGDSYYLGFRIDHAFHYPKQVPVKSDESGIVDLSFRFARVPGFRDHRPVVVTYDLSTGKPL